MMPEATYPNTPHVPVPRRELAPLLGRLRRGGSESYWTAETAAGAVVMLTDREIPDWPEAYRSQCIPQGALPTAIPTDGSPIQAHLSYSSQTADGLRIQKDHFLLRLPRRQ